MTDPRKTHSPLPWEVLTIASELGMSARIYSEKDGGAEDICHIPKEWNYANAEHIVKCVNSHSSLVSALSDIIENSVDSWAVEIAQEALKAAGAL